MATLAAVDFPALVRRLHSGSRVTQLQAANVLLALADGGGPPVADAIVAAGGVPPLISLLSGSGGEAAQRAAVWALHRMAWDSAAARAAILESNAVAALLNLLHPSSSAQPEVSQRAGILLSRLGVEDGQGPRPTFLAAGGAATLVAALASSSELVQHGAAMALAGMTSLGDQATVTACVGAGAVPQLLRCLLNSQHPALLQEAAGALGNVIRDFSPTDAIVEGSTAMPRLLCLANSSDGPGRLQEVAAGTLAKLAAQLIPRNQQPAGLKAALVAAGVIPAAAGMLKRPGGNSSQQAAAALVCFLVPNDEELATQCVAAGMLPCLLRNAKSSDPGLQWSASHALLRLGAYSKEAALALTGARLSFHKPPGVAPDSEQHDNIQYSSSRNLDASEEDGTDWLHDAVGAGICGIFKVMLEPTEAQHRQGVAPQQAQQAELAMQDQCPARMCAAEGCSATRGLRRCGGCGTVRYCSEACCRAHWRVHKAECRRLQAAAKAAGSSGQA